MSIPAVLHPHSHRPVGPISNLILEGLNLNFDPGLYKECVGKPETIENFPISNAKRQYIRGDGSCWARSLWQVVFHQIFATEAKFQKFIQKVADSEVDRELVKKTIFILHKLHGKSKEEQIDYLNYENVDLALVFFMRHSAANYMEKHYSMYPKEVLEDIRTKINRYGGPEINAFCLAFGLDNHRIAKRTDDYRGDWLYYKCQGLPVVAQEAEIEEENRVMMFAANDHHYEVLHFDLPTQVNKPETYPEDLQNSLSLEAKKVLEQIASDAKFAQQLHDEEMQRCAQRRADATLAFSIHQKQHQKASPAQPIKKELPKSLELIVPPKSLIETKPVAPTSEVAKSSNGLVRFFASFWTRFTAFFRSLFRF